MHIADAHVLVTGGSRGIGLGLAREFRARGARLTLLARSDAALRAPCDELEANPLVSDLTDPACAATAIERAEHGQGPVDVLVNNAGLNAPRRLRDTSAAALHDQLAANLLAPLELTRAALPGMQDRGKGTIVNISSITGDVAIRNQVPYCASKSGLSHATRALQRELHRSPVHAMLVVLGLVATDMIADLSADPVGAALARRFAALPELRVEDVARRVVDGVVHRRRSLVLPRPAAPLHHLRLLPTRVVDALVAGIFEPPESAHATTPPSVHPRSQEVLPHVH